ncbi:MAG: DegV family protein [Clostridia bacterium]|nr:DegV family protein [Clostridia bacterium]
MRNFVIVTDSCSELTKEYRDQYEIEYLPMYVYYEEKTFPASLDWETMSAKEYYDLLRMDTRIYTSQVTAHDFLTRFEEYVKNGCDVMYISCSSALSSSINASTVARNEILQQYPDAKIFCIDSKTCSFGEGLLCMYASDLRKGGMPIEEVAEKVEALKVKVNQVATVDELKYLKRAGRISAGKAMFGTLLNVKPIILSNLKGENVSTEKTKGRANSLRRIVELSVDAYTGEEVKDVFISHADCLDEAETVKSLLLEKLPDVNVHIGLLNCAMGASCGPKMLSVYFVGKPKTDL